MASPGRRRRRRKSYFEFMRESIISGIKEYRPAESKHCNAAPLAYLVRPAMEELRSVPLLLRGVRKRREGREWGVIK